MCFRPMIGCENVMKRSLLSEGMVFKDLSNRTREHRILLFLTMSIGRMMDKVFDRPGMLADIAAFFVREKPSKGIGTRV